VDTTQVNEVRFVSDAPIEDFEGVTDRVDGYVFWPGDTLTADGPLLESELYFEVPLDALDTGIDMRNRHMRENYLHTEKFPYVSFRGRIERVASGADSVWQVTANGTFSLHGVEQSREIECAVTQRGRTYHLNSNFEVRLTDHEIEIPSLMFLKINEVIKVRLDVHLVVVP